MDNTGIIISLTALLAALWYVSVNTLTDPLSSFPGPFWAKRTRLWSVWAVLTGREHELIRELHEKYGPVLRWQPNLLLVSDPRLLPLVYHPKADKTPHYNMSISGVASVVEAKSHDQHTILKKRINPPFTLAYLKKMEPVLDKSVAEWVDALDKGFADGQAVFDFSEWPQYLSFDFLTQLFFGKPLGFIKAGSDVHDLIKSTQEGGPILHALARLPGLKRILVSGPWAKYLLPQPGDSVGPGRVISVRDELIDARISSKSPPEYPDILDFLLKAKNPDGTNMALDEIKEEAFFFMMAGSDTTAAAIRSFVSLIADNPSCYDKLRSEIDEAIARGLVSSNTITYDSASKLPYLRACVRECLRYKPSVVSYLPRYTPREGVSIFGQHVPEGVEIGCCSWVTNRDRSVFGDDADVFRPERYLNDPLWAEKVERYEFQWGYGSRRCIGKKLALFILYKALFEFYRNFDVEVVEPGHSRAYLLWIEKGLKIKLVKRERGSRVCISEAAF